jgi:hypothetical protein
MIALCRDFHLLGTLDHVRDRALADQVAKCFCTGFIQMGVALVKDKHIRLVNDCGSKRNKDLLASG